jgi:hypothetical protein
LGLGLLAGSTAHAQAPDSVATLGLRVQQYSQQALAEQLFLHLDRPAYVAGETLWFKVYTVDGTYHRPLPMSKVAYVEVLDAAQRPVLQAKIALTQAMGHGSLELPAELATGRYVVRAYTNWMKNAGPEFYFQCPIAVVNTLGQATAPVATTKAATAYDVQFFPEGGQLVRGLPSRVAFKVTDQYGRGVAATGTVADARGITVASFQTLKFGLGSFLLTPAATGSYTATVRLPGGATSTGKLPAVAEQGYTLLLTDESPTSLTLAVRAQMPQATGPLRLLAHTGQQVTATVETQFANGQAVFQVAKRQLRPGITHFAVFNGRQPVAERLYFRRPARALAIRGSASATAYGPRSQVKVQVGTAQAAALSLAVYRLDSLSAGAPADISSYLLLAADLKGYIEDAGYYFRDSSAVAQQAADNLMLTQGWRRFKWEEVLAGRRPSTPYPPELNGYLLQGRVRQGASDAPADGVSAYLSLPGRSFWFGSTSSHDGGLVQFELPHTYGLRRLVLQTDAVRDSTYRVELLSPFTSGGGMVAPSLLPLTTRWAASLAERHLQVQAQRAFPAPRPTYYPVSTDTIAFYGRPDERYLLDDYTRFPSLEDVMREYVPGVLVRQRKDGFHFMVVDRPRHINLKENPLTLLDGLPIFNLNQLMAFDPLKIKKLEVIANRYFIGQQVYDGLVSYATYKGDLGGYSLNPHALIEEYETIQVPREFYVPRYDTEAQQHSRLPDLRNLLYWNPAVNLTANKPQTLTFSTSDQAGRYLVVTHGLTPDGHLGSTSFSFEVKPAL